MPETSDKRLRRAQTRLSTFRANTRKAPGRLQTEAAIRGRIDALNELWNEFLEAYAEWDDAGGEYASTQFDENENEYEDAKIDLFLLLEPFVKPIAQMERPQPAEGIPQNHGGGIRMKAIEVPTFSGQIEDWVSFRDLFASIVGNNNTITNVQRLQHLRMACQGKAAEIIKHIELTDANYAVAWDALIRRFENERLLVSRMVERLLDLPAMTHEGADQLSALLDGTNQTLNALRVLQQPTEHWDGLTVVLTVRKLDSSTRLLWERSIATTTDMCTYAQLDAFLSGTLRSLEAVRLSDGGAHSQAMSANNSRRTLRTHVAEVRTIECMLCQQPHPLHRCPTLLTNDVAERRQFAERNHICFNCLGSKSHASQTCGSKYRCAICNERHHTLLHAPTTTDNAYRNPFMNRQSTTGSAASVSTNVCRSVTATGVLLPTAWVTIAAANGQRMRVRALIDQASQATLVTERVVQQLAAPKMSVNVNVKGVGGTTAGTTACCVSLAVVSCLEEKGVNVEALVMSKVTSKLPSRPMERAQWQHLDGLPLADATFDTPGDVDLLLGANVFAEILMDGVRHGGRGDVVAQQTVFGWIVTGRAVEAPAATMVQTLHVQLDGLLQKFWEQEELPCKPIVSIEDAACEAIYENSTTREADGRYVVELPFRQGGQELGESMFGAVRRLTQMEKRGMQYPKMYEGYREFMRTYLTLEHMELIPPHEVDSKPCCYLPHHAVFKPDSSTTKLRVVFDATAATTNGKGLNALLLTGPRLQETLSSILMRWRKHPIAISADVEKMYRQIWVARAHQDYQRIVWRESSEQPLQHYRLKTVTYGTASAPYLAVKTMQRLAEEEQASFPLASQVVLNDFYVDDCLSGANTLDEAIALKEELMQMMTAGGMRLMKWSSNSSDLLRTLPDEYIECRAPLSFDTEDGIKALGIKWYPAADEFRYNVKLPEMKPTITKREMLSEIARLFDPLGLLSPVLITAKIQIQRLWQTGLGWNDELPQEVLAPWRRFQQELHHIEDVRIPRWCRIATRCTIELHGFADASMAAYAACVYARVQQEDRSVTVTLMAAKTKVAPIKQQSIPRLELNGAVLLSQLLEECERALKCHNVEAHAWTDSMTVLAWLRKHANVWPTYIANRVSKVHSTMNVAQWRHVPGVENPADVASRGIMPADIRTHRLWWSGPTWLIGARSHWPVQTTLVVDDEALERKKETVNCMVTTEKPMFELATRFSSWPKLLRVTAYLRRMLINRRRDGPCVQADELVEARRCWLQLAQQHEFGDVAAVLNDTKAMRRHGLPKLHPFVDACGMLRVGGRLRNADIAYDEQHPIILPTRNPITELIIIDAHHRVFHAGPQNTMGRLHQQYWVLGERRRVRQILHKCVICVRARPRQRCQLMGDLPSARVTPRRAFLHTAVDYAGPIWSRTTRGRGVKAHKSWVAVFVCLSSKAVHLELVSELTTTAFLAAFRRFTARRGACSDVYADNGTNFVGADRELRAQLREAMTDAAWRAELSSSGTVFHFTPPGAPHFNGLAEAVVKMAKAAMLKTIGETKLTFEEKTTFLSQVEAALNSRPICAMPATADDEGALTPGHLLIGQPLTAVPEPSTIGKSTPTNRWHMVQHMMQHFWRRWSRDYLHQLQQRTKWTQAAPNVAVGDVVIIHDELLHTTRWRTGRVVDVHPGKDDLVRVATIKTSTGVMKRPVVKVTVLPITNSD